jgi:hypothetical protein
VSMSRALMSAARNPCSQRAIIQPLSFEVLSMVEVWYASSASALGDSARMAWACCCSLSDASAGREGVGPAGHPLTFRGGGRIRVRPVDWSK